MRLKLFLTLVIFATVLSSCIKDEPLNKEADIESFTLPEDIIVDVSVTNYEVLAIVKNTNRKKLAPIIKVTEGATVTPASGEEVDFSKGPVIYTVTSEDGGKYKKEYKVTVEPFKTTMEYGFDVWTQAGGITKYAVPGDLLWSTANPGVSSAFIGNVPDGKYPTGYTTDKVSGEYAAILETIKGKNVIIVGYIPVFSGSLFTGGFKAVMSDPLKSTRFGRNHPKEKGKPALFTGYYKYTPGAQLINKEGNVDGVDECSIYSVLYKVPLGEGAKEDIYLDGTNIMTSDWVVAKAIMADGSKQETFKQFSIPFVYTEEPDYENFDYKLAIVFASSKDGDRYTGAIGSTLIIDEVTIVNESY